MHLTVVDKCHTAQPATSMHTVKQIVKGTRDRCCPQIKLLPEHDIGPSDVPIPVVIDGMQLLHSCFDSFL